MTKTTIDKQYVNMEYTILKWLKSVSYVDFYNDISQRVIGQEGLKILLAEVRSYIEGLVYGTSKDARHNVLLAGYSGSGKTETYKALADYFAKHIPGFVVSLYDVSNLTAAGFKGAEPTDVLTPYYQLGFTDVFGICFLDEIDKKMAPSYASTGNGTENINKEVQSQLLSMLSGGDVYNKRGLKINTERLMFIGMGSFNCFRRRREKVHRTIGIVTTQDREKEEVEHDHFSHITLVKIIKNNIN